MKKVRYHILMYDGAKHTTKYLDWLNEQGEKGLLLIEVGACFHTFAEIEHYTYELDGKDDDEEICAMSDYKS